MKILVVSPRSPWPPNKADTMTVNRILYFLFSKKHCVDLICFTTSKKEDIKLKNNHDSICNNIYTVTLHPFKSVLTTALFIFNPLPMQVNYYYSRKMKKLIINKVNQEKYQLCYTHLIRMAEYTRHLSIPKILAIQISQSLNLGRMVNYVKSPLRKLFYFIEYKKVTPYEASVCNNFNKVLLCGKADIETIQNTIPINNAVICPHGQDVPSVNVINKVNKEKNTIIFTGVMSTYTNVDAVIWFVKFVFPFIENAIPDVRLLIVGRNPHRKIRLLKQPLKLNVTGEVLNIYEWLCKAHVAIAPMRIAAGMQNKIIQAMACELPVVATSIANEGIGAKNNKNILIRDNPKEFANAVITLLKNPSKCQRIGKSARSFVEKKWSWDICFEKLEQTIKNF